MINSLKSDYLSLDNIESIENKQSKLASVNWLSRMTFIVPFALTHLACLGVFFVEFSFKAVLVCFLSYFIRGFAITGFFHRYFSHRAFKTSRVVQFIFAVIGAAGAEGGPLWWSAHHRDHHKYSDSEKDQHSPIVHGFWWSHCGWFLLDNINKTKTNNVKDFMKYPEIVLIDRYDILVPICYGTLLFIFGGWQYLIWGYFVSTVLIYHITFSINSVAHLYGKRRFETKDKSRNNLWLALLSFGEGWHNNHHFWPSSARQGFKWHEIDVSFYVLKLLEKCGLIWDLREPPAEILQIK